MIFGVTFFAVCSYISPWSLFDWWVDWSVSDDVTCNITCCSLSAVGSAISPVWSMGWLMDDWWYHTIFSCSSIAYDNIVPVKSDPLAVRTTVALVWGVPRRLAWRLSFLFFFAREFLDGCLSNGERVQGNPGHTIHRLQCHVSRCRYLVCTRYIFSFFLL